MAENVRECVRDDAFGLRWRRIAWHRVCFAGARLAVRQYGAIVAFEHFVNDRAGGVHVQIDLELNESVGRKWAAN